MVRLETNRVIAQQEFNPVIKKPFRYKSAVQGIPLFSILIFYFIIIAYPLFWMVINSFKTTEEIFANSWALPQNWLVSNYAHAWETGISGYFLNSTIVTISTCLLTVFLSALGAYGLTRFEFKGKNTLLIICMAGMMLSPQVSLVPLYKLIQALGIHDTYLALILPYVAYRIPITILLIRAAFLDVPKELEESAFLDGCNTWTVFTKIFIPLNLPILLTGVVLTAYFTWNEFMFALIFVDSEALKTIPAGLMQFRDALQTNWGVLLAGLMISAAPIIILFLFMQKYFIRGPASGSVKG
ncbi:raffinose/stachyose/melibiose transport system permease protein [Cytobacillus oceanisediminis]|uniref:Raffinose/stachyose/melibiose transport system permease protein n=1 Tax=Cytobacillus oceanisediminis TaxID=665099 RepID=A0A2V2ZM52_9BACI|nr:carbohydrate ABC transporter permease [Cytobacillus oceanisediminis]PWW20457.1 raffinose/stachyose/melibiose transport system permease protein [Cytobacillus oceanisediminis]